MTSMDSQWENIQVQLKGMPINGITSVQYIDGKKIVTEGIPAKKMRIKIKHNIFNPDGTLLCLMNTAKVSAAYVQYLNDQSKV